MINYDIDGTHY